MKTILVTLIIMLLAPMTSIASDINDLIKWCEKDIKIKNTTGTAYSMTHTDWYDAGYCFGFITAIANLNEQANRKTKDQKYCIPENNNLDKNVELVIRYFRHNKSTLSIKAVSLTERAFIENFPCK